VRQASIADAQTGRVDDRWMEFFQRLGREFGTWTLVPFDAALFAGWTVQDADQVSFAYATYGQRVDVDFVFRATTSLAVASVTIALPAGIVAARDSSAVIQVNDNGTTMPGMAKVAADGTVITITRVDGVSFTDLRAVEGQLMLQRKQG